MVTPSLPRSYRSDLQKWTTPPDTRSVRRARFSLCLAVLATAGALSACASGGGTPRPFPTPGGWPDEARSRPDAPAPGTPGSPLPGTLPGVDREVTHAVVSTALTLLGTPYRNGGADPDGFDCSGFVQYVYGQQGIAMPRTVEDLSHVGSEVRRWQAGDLVFFQTSGRGATHVGIAVDADRFVHAPSSRGVVRVEPFARAYWAERFLLARRIIDDQPTQTDGKN